MKVVRLSDLRIGRLYPHEGFLLLIYVRGWVDPRATMRPEGLSHWKIPVNPSGIEPATFRLLTQCLNQLRQRVPVSLTRKTWCQERHQYPCLEPDWQWKTELYALTTVSAGSDLTSLFLWISQRFQSVLYWSCLRLWAQYSTHLLLSYVLWVNARFSNHRKSSSCGSNSPFVLNNKRSTRNVIETFVYSGSGFSE
jgi:hypothetical protein